MAQNQWVLPDGFDDTVKKALSVLFKALKNAKRAIPPAAIDAVRVGDWEAFQRLMNWNGVEESFEAFKTILSDQAKAAAVQMYKDGGVGSKLTFDLIDDRAVFFAQTRAAQLVTEITEEMRGNIRTIITSATLGDKTWQQAAEEINASLPLTSRDAAAVEKYRVRQFERFMKKGLTEASARTKSNSMRDAYAEKLTQSRASTIARTEIATAASEGRYLGWEAGIESGMVDGASVKEWIAEPSACDICQPMDGKTIPWDAEFPAGVLMPPAHPNCRCAAAILPPDYADSVFTNQALIKGKSNQFEIEFAKHLAGKHDQSSHGNGFNANDLSHLSDEDKALFEKWREAIKTAKTGKEANAVLEADQPEDAAGEAKNEFLNEWVQGDFRGIQRSLVSEGSDEYYDEVVEKADYAYERNTPLSDRIVLHRAASTLPFDPETAKPWDKIKVPVYTATTTSTDLSGIRRTGLGGSNTINIVCQKGSRKVLWNGEGGENEAVINRGAIFRVLDVRKDGDAWDIDLVLR